MSASKYSNGKTRFRGFMCQSPAATAVGCVPDDMRAVVVPSKGYGRSSMVCNDNNSDVHGRIARNVKYTRLNNGNNQGKEILLPLISDRGLSKGDNDHRRRRHHHHHQLPSVVPQKQKPKNLQMSSLGSNEIFQVVVLRVSLHCQGCAGKVKKHLSRMEGVTSFSIDLETKRVTVMGHVSPTVVLESVSKIKRAEFWTTTC